MLKVGIYTPYVRNEVTLAAVQLADWLVACGIEVSMLSDGRVEQGVHPIWDDQVKRNRHAKIYSWAYGATHLCWFSADTEARHKAKLMGPRFASTKSTTKNYYFPHWSRFPEDNTDFLMVSDRVICFNHSLCVWLQRMRSIRKIPMTDPTWANLVAPDKILIPKHGTVSPDHTKLLAIFTKDMILDIGLGMFKILGRQLQEHKALSITVLLERSVPRNYRIAMNKLAAKYHNRISYITNPPYYRYVELARQHDWVYLANTRNLIGSQFAALIPSSVPLICHAVPPASNYVSNGVNGRLIPCKVHYENVPIAELNTDVIGDHLNEILAEPVVALKAMQLTGYERYNKNQEAFRKFIYKEFVT